MGDGLRRAEEIREVKVEGGATINPVPSVPPTSLRSPTLSALGGPSSARSSSGTEFFVKVC